MNSRQILLPFFTARLALEHLLFVIGLIVKPLKRYIPLAVIFSVFAIYTIYLSKGLIYSDKSSISGVKEYPINPQNLQIITIGSYEKLEEVEQTLTNLQEISPGNRTILLNLALISYYKDNNNLFLKNWSSAVFSDPNNQVFQL